MVKKPARNRRSSLVLGISASLLVLGGTLPWENFHPDSDAMFVEDFQFNPSQWLWRGGAMALGLTAAFLIRGSDRSSKVRQAPMATTIGTISCLWMLGATSLIGFSYYDFEDATPEWFTESTIPWIGFYVAWVGAASLLLLGVVRVVRERRNKRSA